MTLDAALRLSEILMALAFIQQSAEHWATDQKDRAVFGLRILMCLGLLTGWHGVLFLLGLAAVNIALLVRFQGPYNGGSDRMSVLILWCLLAVELAPGVLWKEAIFAYLAFQLTLSYFMSGKVKLFNPDWRSGEALCDVFAFSAYPVTEDLRGWAQRPATMRGASWFVIGFEIAFPLALLHPAFLWVALCITATFHLANAWLFGLNRFVWVWIAGYPALIWFQGRVFGGFGLGLGDFIRVGL